MPLRTCVPTSITPELLRLSRSINAARPVWVQVVPDGTAQPRECFPNVRQRVKRDGGRIVYGWALWECRPIFVEAEHHAVYEASAGSEWLDVTPHMPTISNVLFLPDETAVYDFGTTRQRDNIRQSTVHDPLVSQLLNLYSNRTEILNQVPAIGGAVTLTGADAQDMTATLSQIKDLCEILARKYQAIPKKLGRNDACPCGSGAKFKRCCGR